MSQKHGQANLEKLREEFKKDFCFGGSDEFKWIMLDIGSPIDGEEVANWWLSKIKELMAEVEEETRASKMLWERQKEWLKEWQAENPKERSLTWPDALKLIEWKIKKTVSKEIKAVLPEEAAGDAVGYIKGFNACRSQILYNLKERGWL